MKNVTRICLLLRSSLRIQNKTQWMLKDLLSLIPLGHILLYVLRIFGMIPTAKNQIGLHEICLLDSSTNQKKYSESSFSATRMDF